MSQTKTMALECTLTQDEQIDRSKKLARKLSEGEALEAELDTFKTDMKRRMKKVTAEVSELRQAIQTGSEVRAVRVIEEFDYVRGKAIVTRCDTGEVVIERELTDEERQTRLPIQNKSEGEEPAPAPAPEEAPAAEAAPAPTDPPAEPEAPADPEAPAEAPAPRRRRSRALAE